MIAVPIRLGDSVIGLLEVFSSQSNAFNDRHGTMLQRLADTILAAVNRATRARMAPAQTSPANRTPVSFGPSFGTGGGSYPFASFTKEEEKTNGSLNFSQSHLTLLVVAAVSIVIALTYFLTPWVVEQFRPTKKSEPRAQTSAPLLQPTVVAAAKPLTLAETRKRAENGDPYEQVALAARYATGEDVPQDYSMAVRWFIRAAEQGHVGAQDALGAYYSAGRGVPRDLNRAYYWSVMASEAGKETSRERVAFMTSQFTTAQALSIEQEARKFMKQHPSLNNSDIAH